MRRYFRVRTNTRSTSPRRSGASVAGAAPSGASAHESPETPEATCTNSAVRRRSGPLLVVALLPLAGLAGYFFFAIAYPTPDGDVLKPTFMLSTLWAWALCFGWAATWAGRRAPRLVAGTLIALGVLILPFVVYNGAVGMF